MRGEHCGLGPQFCTEKICDCDRSARGEIDIKVLQKAGRKAVGVAHRRGGRVILAKLDAWKRHWRAMAIRDAIDRAGVCVEGECYCPNCREWRELKVRAAAIQYEYTAVGEALSDREAFLRASPDAKAAAARSPYAAPMGSNLRAADFGDLLTKIEKWLDSTPIRWEDARTVHPRRDHHEHA